jgi:hypothetical protein
MEGFVENGNKRSTAQNNEFIDQLSKFQFQRKTMKHEDYYLVAILQTNKQINVFFPAGSNALHAIYLLSQE